MMEELKDFVVGIDADGVLTNLTEFYKEQGMKYFKKEPVNPKAYSFIDMFGLNKFQKVLYGPRILDKYCRSAKLRDGAKEVISKLDEEGCELHEITARMFTTFRNPFGEYYRRLFQKYLDKHELKFKSIQFCSETDSPRDKYMGCSKLSVDVMIEDKPDVAMYLAEKGIKILLFDAPYNQEISHENITRVNSWNECYEHISRMKAEKKAYIPFERKTKEEKAEMTPEAQVEYLKSYKYYLKNLKVNEEAFKKRKRNFKLVYSLMKIPFKIIFRAKQYGKENIPYQDGFIIASNHLNSYDQFYIINALGNRQLNGFAGESVRDSIRGRLFSLTGGVIYIDRKDPESKQIGEEELASRIVNNEIGIIFPEGTRKNVYEEHRDKLQLPFKFGTVAMAQKTGAPILPISLHHGEKGSYVRIGELFFVRKEDNLELANARLEQTIKEMTLKSMEEDSKKREKVR